MLSHSKAKKLLQIISRRIGTTSRISASHYDVLGVTPKATQSDIKSAYYNLSKLYHPDTSKDDESAKKFRAITEAYKVLGNIKLKKMYDKGLLVGRENTSRMDYKADDEPTDPVLKFYKSRHTRNVVPTMDGKTPIYDFDTWSKNHYGDLLKKSQYEKEFIQKKRQKIYDETTSVNQEMVMYFMISICALFAGFLIYGKSDYDQNIIEKQKDPNMYSKNTKKPEKVSNS
ncbi:unnamed protein product, partial [Brenthis ino]